MDSRIRHQHTRACAHDPQCSYNVSGIQTCRKPTGLLVTQLGSVQQAEKDLTETQADEQCGAVCFVWVSRPHIAKSMTSSTSPEPNINSLRARARAQHNGHAVCTHRFTDAPATLSHHGFRNFAGLRKSRRLSKKLMITGHRDNATFAGRG